MTGHEQYFGTNIKNLIFHQRKTKSFDGYRHMAAIGDVKVNVQS